MRVIQGVDGVGSCGERVGWSGTERLGWRCTKSWGAVTIECGWRYNESEVRVWLRDIMSADGAGGEWVQGDAILNWELAGDSVHLSIEFEHVRTFRGCGAFLFTPLLGGWPHSIALERSQQVEPICFFLAWYPGFGVRCNILPLIAPIMPWYVKHRTALLRSLMSWGLLR